MERMWSRGLGRWMQV